ncbi:MAG TPA: quinate 5-dehydrogenase [Syntrophomonadaceae bacterium]|nr:quinate 5-dehydrogenase [Syntrophomonadaceae bacterium]
MKRVVSVSLGSSKRDHKVEAEFLGEKFVIERIGTDGDMQRAIQMIRELDGKVDAFGMGGIDLYLVAGNRRYALREAKKIAAAAKKTPIVDGSGLKNTLERRVIEYLQHELGWNFKDRRALVVSGVDRFGIAEALWNAGCKTTYGDLIFAMGIPIPIRSLSTLRILAYTFLPVLSQLPFKYLYPTGKKQETVTSKYDNYYHDNEIIAGDFHFIRKYMPPELPDKMIITNTVTKDDLELLRERGVKVLVTTTPEMEGRSFGTNVMEGVLISLLGKRVEEVTPEDYSRLLEQLQFKPRIVYLQDEQEAGVN